MTDLEIWVWYQFQSEPNTNFQLIDFYLLESIDEMDSLKVWNQHLSFSFMLSSQHIGNREGRGRTRGDKMKALTLNKRHSFITSHGFPLITFRDQKLLGIHMVCVIHHSQGHFGVSDDYRKMSVLINFFPILKSV